jgi:sugar O-acyltransferase (sialic acid O-acetyltransferase NeuD family)
MKDLVIWGAGAVGRQITQIVEDQNAVKATWNLVGYIDDDTSKINESIAGFPVLGDYHWLSSRNNTYVALGIGSPSSLFSAYQKLQDMQHTSIATLIHPSVWRARRVEIGQGSIVYAGTIIDPDVKIGFGCVINKGCTIGHDAVLGDFVSLAPGVNLGGSIQVGCGSYFGMSSATIQGVSIGDWSVIGAGAVVVKDLPANVTAVGIPAHVIKTRQEGWHLQ